ncbi:glycoside hydrolase 43 family protein, partial [candidate division KSB1 bacterium]
MKTNYSIFFLSVICPLQMMAGSWVPDLGNGSYKNPIIYADYSDPDVIRVGEDFFLTASSFNCMPALPILHSKDLVNWRIVNHAIKSWPDDYFDLPQHGNGVWAPSLRYHNGHFWIYYGDPDQGIFMVKTSDPFGEWEQPVLVKKAKGWIDPCPLWDDDGSAYLVHAFANSRAGIKSVLHINRMSADGTKLLDEGTLVFDGHANHPTIEGPKFYKMNGYYYIFAPAGGVATGWQTVLRSRTVFGPYEDKIVLAQGETPINGPHQGGYVELENGDSWFVHFQDLDPYGRITHLQPMVWKDDWPVMGIDSDGDGISEPVLEYAKPAIGKAVPITIPQTSDEFEDKELGLQWQWHASPISEWYDLRDGALLLHSQPTPADATSLWPVPNLLLQKFPAPNFSVTTKITFAPNSDGEKMGLIVMGLDYAYLAVEKNASGLSLVQAVCHNADKGAAEQLNQQLPIQGNTVYFKVDVMQPGVCSFSFSLDGRNFQPFGAEFGAQPGKWIGAKV